MIAAAIRGREFLARVEALLLADEVNVPLRHLRKLPCKCRPMLEGTRVDLFTPWPRAQLRDSHLHRWLLVLWRLVNAAGGKCSIGKDGMSVDEQVDVGREPIAHDVRRKVAVDMVMLCMRRKDREDVWWYVKESESSLLEKVDSRVRLIAARDILKQDLQQRLARLWTPPFGSKLIFREELDVDAVCDPERAGWWRCDLCKVELHTQEFNPLDRRADRLSREAAVGVRLSVRTSMNVPVRTRAKTSSSAALPNSVSRPRIGTHTQPGELQSSHSLSRVTRPRPAMRDSQTDSSSHCHPPRKPSSMRLGMMTHTLASGSSASFAMTTTMRACGPCARVEDDRDRRGSACQVCSS